MTDGRPNRQLHRDELRERWSNRVPRWYSPVLHLLLDLVVAGAAIVWLTVDLFTHGARGWAWLTPPLVFMLANVLEYTVHRHPMHKRRRILDGMFKRHTLWHHRYFTHDVMEVHSMREVFFAMFPLQFAALAFLTGGFVYVGLRTALGADVAALGGITFLLYFLMIEWMHLTFHLPVRWIRRIPVGGRVLNALREHHRIHHNPRLMNRYNFNITLPFTDWILRTAHTSDESEAELGLPGSAEATVSTGSER